MNLAVRFEENTVENVSVEFMLCFCLGIASAFAPLKLPTLGKLPYNVCQKNKIKLN